ncbi:hypothetical protein L9F63_026369, partial [Diploptera punctata]
RQFLPTIVDPWYMKTRRNTDAIFLYSIHFSQLFITTLTMLMSLKYLSDIHFNEGIQLLKNQFIVKFYTYSTVSERQEFIISNKRFNISYIRTTQYSNIWTHLE